MASGQARRRQTLNLRIRPGERALIDQAARLQNKNRTEFVLEAAHAAAEAALLDRVLFTVDAAAFRQFQAALDGPARPSERLRKTMKSSVWPVS